MDLSLISTWLTIIGAAMGALAFLWNVGKWAVNKRRRRNQDIVELTNYDKMIDDEKQDCAEYSRSRKEEFDRNFQRLFSSTIGPGREGPEKSQPRVRDSKEQMEHDIAKRQRESLARIRQLEVEKSRIRNRPVE